MLVTAILHSNNIRDLASDSSAGFRTLAGILGSRASLRLYYFLAFAPYLFTFTFGSIWPPVFCAASVPLAVKLKERADRGGFALLVPETARFLAVWGLLFCGGLYMTY
jgi:1,4-dihydroxy-2-naphthoate octaprenyltransferase